MRFRFSLQTLLGSVFGVALIVAIGVTSGVETELVFTASGLCLLAIVLLFFHPTASLLVANVPIWIALVLPATDVVAPAGRPAISGFEAACLLPQMGMHPLWLFAEPRFFILFVSWLSLPFAFLSPVVLAFRGSALLFGPILLCGALAPLLVWDMIETRFAGFYIWQISQIISALACARIWMQVVNE